MRFIYMTYIFVLEMALTSFSQELLVGEGRIYDAAFSPDGQTIMTGSSIGLQTWDAEMLTKKKFMRVPYGARMIKWSPDGQYLFALRGNNQDHLMIKMPEFIVMYHIPDSLKLAQVSYTVNPRENQLEGYHYPFLEVKQFKVFKHPNFVNFSHDSQQLVIINSDNNMILLSTDSGEIIQKWTYYQNEISVAFFEDNDQSLVNDIEKINIKTRQSIDKGLGDNISALSPSGKYIVKQSNHVQKKDEAGEYTLYEGKISTQVLDRVTGNPIQDNKGYIDTGCAFYNADDNVNTENWYVLPHRYFFYQLQSENMEYSEYLWIHAPKSDRVLVVDGWFRYDSSAFCQYSFDLVSYGGGGYGVSCNQFYGTSSYTQPFNRQVNPQCKKNNKIINLHIRDWYNFNLAFGLRVNNITGKPPDYIFGLIGPDETERSFQDVHYPYKNIHFMPQHVPCLQSMQIPGGNPFKSIVEFRNPETKSVSKKTYNERLDSSDIRPCFNSWSEDGSIFAAYSGFRDLCDPYRYLCKMYIFETDLWTLQHEILLKDTRIGMIQLFDHNKKLVYAGEKTILEDVSLQSKMAVWDINSQKELYSILPGGDLPNAGDHIVLDLDVSPDHQRILYATRYEMDINLFEWEFEIGQLSLIERFPNSIHDESGLIRYVQYISAGNEALLVYDTGDVLLYDLQADVSKFQFTSPFFDHEDKVYPVSLSKDETYLIVGNTIWNWKQQKQVGQFGLDLDAIMEMDISPDNEWLAAGMRDGVLGIWKISNLVKDQSGLDIDADQYN